MTGLRGDPRYALRTFRKSPGFAAAARSVGGAESILYGVHASDPWVFAVGAALKAAVSMAVDPPRAQGAVGP